MITTRENNADVRITASLRAGQVGSLRPLQQKCNPRVVSHWPWNGELLCPPTAKSPKPSRSTGSAASRRREPGPPIVLGARRFGLRVANDLFQLGEIFEEPPPPGRRQAAVRVRPSARVALNDLDQPGPVQHVEMAVEIAVGQ